MSTANVCTLECTNQIVDVLHFLFLGWFILLFLGYGASMFAVEFWRDKRRLRKQLIKAQAENTAMRKEVHDMTMLIGQGPYRGRL